MKAPGAFGREASRERDGIAALEGHCVASTLRKAHGAPWLPEVATQAVFDSLNAEMADLARRGGVSSWLFT